MNEYNKSKDKISNINYQRFNGNHSLNLLLLHGFLGSQQIWEPLQMELSKHANLITLDLPGHGKSPCNDEVLTMSQMAMSVKEVLDICEIDSVHVVGHSMGGYVALELLNNYPNLIDSITLLNSTANSDSEQKKADRLRAVKVFDLSPRVYIREAITNLFYNKNLDKISEEVERLQEIALGTSVMGAKACLRGMKDRTNFINLINSSPTPVQYLAGVHDNTVTYQSITDQIENEQIKLVAFENSGHMSFAEQKHDCIEAIITFIKEP